MKISDFPRGIITDFPKSKAVLKMLNDGIDLYKDRKNYLDPFEYACLITEIVIDPILTLLNNTLESDTEIDKITSIPTLSNWFARDYIISYNHILDKIMDLNCQELNIYINFINTKINIINSLKEEK